MMRWLLLFAVATSALAGDDLEKRLEPFREEPEFRIHAVVYDRYPSGRPRRVVAAIGNVNMGDLWLFRFPDSPKGKPRVLDKPNIDAIPSGVELVRIIHPKDIVVEYEMRHGSSALVGYIVNDHFVQIANDFTEAIDLDGDGVPEIISSGFVGSNQCGTAISTYISRWNGKRFVNDGHRYVTVLALGGGQEEDELLLSSSKRYVVRLFGSGRVTLDHEEIKPGKAFSTEEDCHTIALHDATPKTRAFLEELP